MASPAPSYLQRASTALNHVRQTLKEADLVRTVPAWIKDQEPKVSAAWATSSKALAKAGRATWVWVVEQTPKVSRALARSYRTLAKAGGASWTWTRAQAPKVSAALGRARQLWEERAAATAPNKMKRRTPKTAPAREPLPDALEKAPPDSALLLLGLLQKEGRLLDFLQEDIKSYSDQEVGAAARVLHQGCQRVLREHLKIAPVRDEPEGSRITLEQGFDAASIRPTGNLVGDPPFTGSLVHRGWRVVETRLPQVASGHDLRILAAAEVEL